MAEASSEPRSSHSTDVLALGLPRRIPDRYAASGVATMMQIAEADWRRLSKLKPLALERLCSRILQEVTQAASEQAGISHERYLRIFRLIEQGDKQISRAFDDLRRSNALLKLAAMRRAQLITEEEFEAFGDETKSAVACML